MSGTVNYTVAVDRLVDAIKEMSHISCGRGANVHAAADSAAANAALQRGFRISDDEKKRKSAAKEGGKTGIQLKGMAENGGVEFVTTQIETAEGDLGLLLDAMNAANEPVDESDEVAKGGSENVGKMLLSVGDKYLALACYVPLSLQTKCDPSEWMNATLQSAHNVAIVRETDTVVSALVDCALRPGLPDQFPLKLRDTCYVNSRRWLQSKGLIRNDEEEDRTLTEQEQEQEVEW
jgi:hypothetical protein